MAKPAALGPKALASLAGRALPKPRVNLTRYHGVFAPNCRHRAEVTPAKRGKGNKDKATPESGEEVPNPRVATTWAQRLKRVFNIDIVTCRECGAAMRVIAYTQTPQG